MHFTTDRETLLKPMTTVQGVVERRQTLPILANVLLSVRDGTLTVCATDMEVEMVARTPMDGAEEGEVTVPGRKLMDICRALPEGAKVSFTLKGERVTVQSGRSRFTLTTLPAVDFPAMDQIEGAEVVALAEGALKRMIELTAFAMAQQDVRYYLNGLLLEVSPERLRAVATDGHRLALADVMRDGGGSGEVRQIIVPRKGVAELGRLLEQSEDTVEVVVGANAVQATVRDVRFTSKLIDGRFPDYERVIPSADGSDKVLEVSREALRTALSRASILSNEKYRAVRWVLGDGVLRVSASNPEQEEAQDEVAVDYDGEELEIGFNVSYLIEALSTLPGDSARIYLTDASSSCLIRPESDEGCEYVVMPMRL